MGAYKYYTAVEGDMRVLEYSAHFLTFVAVCDIQRTEVSVIKNREEGKMSIYEDPCLGCKHETSACLLVQGQCYYKKVAEKKEQEKQCVDSKSVSIPYRLAPTD